MTNATELDLAVLTTVYPGVEPYLVELADSLRAQDDPSFVLYVVNDALDEDMLVEAFAPLTPTFVAPGTSPAENRRAGIEALIADGVRQVVFLDADDTMAADRVGACRRALERRRLVFNELVVPPDGPMIGGRYTNGAVVTWRDLLDFNVLGMSNTAAHLAAVAPHVEHIGEDPNVVDWGLFTRMLHQGDEAEFLADVHTYYRRHEGSFALLSAEPEVVARAIEVKARHYDTLAALDPELARRAEVFGALRRRVQQDDAELERYVARCRRALPTQPLWWEVAVAPDSHGERRSP